MLCSPQQVPGISGLRRQLRTSRMPGSLVSSIPALHVPMSWRSLLCRRLPRLRPSRTWTLHLRFQNRQWAIADQRRTDAHAFKLRKARTDHQCQRRLSMQRLKMLYEWFELRLQLGGPVKDAALHPVPRNTASWWYVFGSAAFTLLFLQIFTGILLALVYVPSAGQAWSSLNILNHQLELGWFLRAMHGWGSNFMVAIVLIHMAQVFLFGAYKYPRELTWIVGVFLLLTTLGMAFTGQILRFDQDAYWGLGIGASIMGRVPVFGPAAVKLMLGGPIIAGATLSRFFALHVFVIPGLLIAFVGLHLLMVLKLGINEWPMPGRLVRRSDYREQYRTLTHTGGVPFVP